MVISTVITTRLKEIAPGQVFTTADFDIPHEHQRALVKALNRRVQKGELKKIAKGKFFKPQVTVFGEVMPDISELVKDYLKQGDNIVGYITGTQAFAKMGLTTQISTEILIGTNNYRKPRIRNGYSIRFVSQKNKIDEGSIDLLRLLDAIKMINEIPATTPSEVTLSLILIIKELEKAQRLELSGLAKAYTPKVRALLGAILEYVGDETSALKSSLNGVTTYNVGITEKTLPTIANWNII